MIKKLIKKLQSFFRIHQYMNSSPNSEIPKLYRIGLKSKENLLLIYILTPIGVLLQILFWLIFGYSYKLNDVGLKFKNNNKTFHITPIEKVTLYQRVLTIYTILTTYILLILNSFSNSPKLLNFMVDDLLMYSIFNSEPKNKKFFSNINIMLTVYNLIFTFLFIIYLSYTLLSLFVINSIMIILTIRKDMKQNPS